MLRLPRHLSLAAALLAAAATAVLGVCAATALTSATTRKITPSGVGAVQLGRRYLPLRAAKQLGKVQPGCELAGPQARAADLIAPLKGSVTLTDSAPRRIAAISVRGGATARGVGTGSTTAALKHAFPRAKFDRSTEAVFGITVVKVPKSGGGPLQFAVNAKTDKVTAIAIPAIAFCD